jgi:hypothetical protein
MVDTFCDVGDWKIPKSHHLTLLYLNRNASKMSHEIYQKFKAEVW